MGRFPPPASLGPLSAGGGGGGGSSSPYTLNIANSGRQTGSDWADNSSNVRATWAAATDGVLGVNQNLWDDLIFWDLTQIIGTDLLVSASPIIALDWQTVTHPGEASIIGYGFCAAANLTDAAVQTASRWSNLYNDGSSSEAAISKRNQATGQTGTVRNNPAISRCLPSLLGNAWSYGLAQLDHAHGSGTDPTTSGQSSVNTLTSSNKIYAWLAGGPKSAAVGQVTWEGTLKFFYGGGH